MGLESGIETGAKYISDLNPLWPLGTDSRKQGDNHVRGIKNVLQKTFPNVNGPVTLTEEELNRGSVPKGSRTVFYQAAPPVGWVRVTNIADTHMLRVVRSGIAGGTVGGAHDPVKNDKVPEHTHKGFTASAGAHTHTISVPTGTTNVISGAGGGVYSLASVVATSSNGAHQHAIDSVPNLDPAIWEPRYLDVILCEKS